LKRGFRVNFKPEEYLFWRAKMEQFLSAETIIIELLLVVTVVAIAVRRLNVPYTVALVLVGLALTLQHSITVNLTSELILALFVPPLVFEAALHINFSELRRGLPEILVLAGPGVIVTTLIVGGLISMVTPLALPAAMVFGALISATDPVAVVAMFRTLGVTKKLAVLVESESLLNDGTAIVVFNLAIAAALTGHFSPLDSLGEFTRVALGGIAAGLALGWLVSQMISRIDDYLIETTLTTLLAFGAYLLAERLHFSGVLAVVAAGLVTGNLGPQGMSPTTRIVITNFWEYVAFLANSLIFLLLGLEINLPALLGAWQPVMWAILAVVLARLIVVYGFGALINRFSREKRLPLNWLHVLNWGGLRGAIALALVFSLPAGLSAQAELMKLMAFGVVLFTLLVQSTTMSPLLRRLGLITHPPEQVEYEKRHARLTAARAALSHLERRHDEGLISSHAWDLIKPQMAAQVESLTNDAREMLQSAPGLEAEELETARREGLRAQRSALLGLRHDGVISHEVFDELAADIDAIL
jgi:CPA1 family monovalent cation:H+ antiporter